MLIAAPHAHAAARRLEEQRLRHARLREDGGDAHGSRRHTRAGTVADDCREASLAHLCEADGECAEAHRCAKFFFTLVEGKNAEIVTRAICANVENELGLALSQAEVAAWLGKSMAGVQPA